MSDFKKLVKNSLPLFIKASDWNGDSLTISGDGWSFTTNSVWRISCDNCLLLACWDDEVDGRVEALVGLSIIEMSWVVSTQPIDPSFKLSNGQRLDIFCSFSSEPWVLTLPDNKVYVGNS